MICHWAINRTDPQNLLSITLDVPLQIWLNIGLEKIDTYEGITGMFMDRKVAARYGFKLQKLNRPVAIRNIDGMNNSAGAITYWVEVNVYYKDHIERMKMKVCDLERTEVILGMLWLQAHNPEIN